MAPKKPDLVRFFVEIKNFTTEEIINEIKEVISRPKIAERLGLAEQKFILNVYKDFSEIVYPAIAYRPIKEDMGDNKFIDCAKSVGADYIISGDKHLLRLKEFKGVKIISPADFIRKIMC